MIVDSFYNDLNLFLCLNQIYLKRFTGSYNFYAKGSFLKTKITFLYLREMTQLLIFRAAYSRVKAIFSQRYHSFCLVVQFSPPNILTMRLFWRFEGSLVFFLLCCQTIWIFIKADIKFAILFWYNRYCLMQLYLFDIMPRYNQNNLLKKVAIYFWSV